MLTQQQIERFITDGYVTVEGALERDFCKSVTDRAWQRLDYDPADPSTWKQPHIHLPRSTTWPVSEIAPRAWEAICQLAGGAENVRDEQRIWDDSLIVNLRRGGDEPWQPPSRTSPGWHKDGDWFKPFLDSPEIAILCLVMWSDILPQSGGTFFVPGCVGPVARYLVKHPEGTRCGDYGDALQSCDRFAEATGRAGDVILCHGFMIHASSSNPSGRPRFLTNPAHGLKQSHNFNRANVDDYNPLELAILRGLGVERLDFQITTPRERIIPQREIDQARMLEEERKRLAGTR